MIQEIARLYKLGKSDQVIDFKIVEAHRNKYYEKMNEIVKDYDCTLISIEILQEQDKLLDFEQKKLEDELKDKQTLETEYPWLLEDKDILGNYAIPEFIMSADDVRAFKVANYQLFRQGGYDSKNQFELMEDGLLDQHRAEIRARIPKE